MLLHPDHILAKNLREPSGLFAQLQELVKQAKEYFDNQSIVIAGKQGME
jgi:hypothetical protein